MCVKRKNDGMNSINALRWRRRKICKNKTKSSTKNGTTTEILELMEQRRMAKKDSKKYQILNKEIKKKCNEAKEKWLKPGATE